MPHIPLNSSSVSDTTSSPEEAATKEISAGYSALAGLEAELSGVRHQIEQRQRELSAARTELEMLNKSNSAIAAPQAGPLADQRAEILESISDAFYALDARFNFIYTNSKALEIWGMPGENLIGKNFWDAFHAARNSESGKLHLQAMESRRSVRYETFSPVLHSWIDVSIYPDRNGGLSVYFRDISDRKATEEALRDSESRLRIITDLVPDLLWCSYPDGQTDWYNKRWLEYTGQSLKQALGWGWTEVIHPEDREASAASYGAAARLGTSLRLVHRIRRYDGAYRWFLVQVEPQKSRNGELVRLYGTATDIHEQRTVLDALGESEAQLRITLESATDYAIISTNIDGVIDGWSAGAELVFGYPASEAIGMPADIIFTPEDVANGVPDREMGTARTRGWAADERWHIRKDGTRFYMSGVMRPILNPELRGYVKVARDMTQQQEAAERLRISEERLRIALKSAEMGTWDWNMQSDQSIWNEQHFLMLGLSPDGAAASVRLLLERIHPEDRATFSRALDEAVSQSGTLNTKFRIVRADTGAIHWMQGYGRVIGTLEAVPVRMVGVLYDITESKDIEQQKDQFIAVASHELRTPVTAMKAYAEVLRDMLQESGEGRSYQLISKLDGQIDRMANLVRDLLDVTRIRERRLELRRERFDLGALLQEVADEMGYAGQPRIELELGEATPVYADRERIRQVLTNLLSNAMRYSPEDAPVIISLHRHRQEILVCVRDFGAGLAPEFRSQVFERYFRAGTRQDNAFPELGLGLYIAAEIVRWHEGKIWVENPQPAGAMFCFTLPDTA